MIKLQCISIKDGQIVRRSPRLMENKYPITKRIRKISTLIKIEQVIEINDGILKSIEVLFSINIPPKCNCFKSVQNPYRLSPEVQEKIMKYLNSKDLFNIIRSGLWSEVGRSEKIGKSSMI